MSDIPLEDETRSVDEIIAAAKNVINSWSPQFTADEVLAVATERDQARKQIADAPHAQGCILEVPPKRRTRSEPWVCSCWKVNL